MQAKLKVKMKTKAATDVEGIVPEGDKLFDMVHEIENLTDQDAALAEAQTSIDGLLAPNFKLGGILSVMLRNGWHCGYEKFADMVMGEFGFKLAKAYDLIRIYELLCKMEIPYDVALNLGITKLRLLSRKWWLNTITDDDGEIDKEAFFYAVEKAKASKFPELESYLVEQVKAKHQAADEEGEGEDDQPDGVLLGLKPATVKKPTGTLTLHPHKDQAKLFSAAIAKAKQITNSDVATVNMEAICIDFLGNAEDPNTVPITIDVVRDWMKKTDPIEILEEFKKAYPNWDAEVAMQEKTK